MPPNARFRRNMAVVAVLHIVLVVSLARWSGGAKKPVRSEILWMDGGTAGAAASTVAAAASPPEPTLPLAEPPPVIEEPAAATEPEESEPMLTTAASDLELPAPSPTPEHSATARPTAIPKPTPKAKPTPAAKPTPKPARKPSPKPTATPKPTPRKTLLAKASPPPRPRESATPRPPEKPALDKAVEIAPVPPMKDAAEPSTATDGERKTAAATATQRGTGGSGGRGSGPGGASQFGWYSRMLHDRFFGAWVQPTTVVTTGVKMSALVKLRIEKDGRVSSFAIVRSSGNVVVDESVEAVARRVPQVDALPAGLSDGPYDVSINFELRSE